MRRKFYFLFAFAVLFSGTVHGEDAAADQEEAVEDNYQLETSISGVYGNGQYLVMQDDSKWEIREKDRNKTGGWLGPADVKITKSDDPHYPYQILNKWTGTIVFARPVVDTTDSANPQAIP